MRYCQFYMTVAFLVFFMASLDLFNLLMSAHSQVTINATLPLFYNAMLFKHFLGDFICCRFLEGACSITARATSLLLITCNLRSLAVFVIT